MTPRNGPTVPTHVGGLALTEPGREHHRPDDRGRGSRDQRVQGLPARQPAHRRTCLASVYLMVGGVQVHEDHLLDAVQQRDPVDEPNECLPAAQCSVAAHARA